MDSKTVGSAGAYTDLNSWASYVQGALVSAGNLTDEITAQITAGGITTSSQQVVSGWAPGGSGYQTIIEPNTGAGYKDHANVRTSNALHYNTANGAFIASSYSNTSGAISIQVEKSRIKGLQIKATGGYTRCISYDTTTITDLILDGNLLWATNTESGVVTLNSNVDGANCFIRNNVIRGDRTAGGSSTVRSFGNTSSTNRLRLHNNTLWQAAGSSQNVNCGTDTRLETIGNIFLDNTTCSIACRDAQCTGSNNSTADSAWDGTAYGAGTITGLTSSQFSIIVANEFVDADSAPTDFKLKVGGTACQANNITISGITTDCTGYTRAVGFEDRGAYQLTAGGAAFLAANSNKARQAISRASRF